MFTIYYGCKKRLENIPQVLTMVTSDGWDSKNIFFSLHIDMVFQVFCKEYTFI